MFKKTMRVAAVAVGAFLAAFSAKTASADPVFSVTGGFNGGATSLTNSVSVTNGTDTATLTFNGVSNEQPIPGLAGGATSGADFGTLSLSETGPAGGGLPSFVGTTFQILITQTAPPNGSAPLTANLSGTVTSVSNENVKITFTTSSVTLGQYTYTLDSSTTNIPIASDVTDFTGTVTNIGLASTPLPASVWGGMGLFGLLGAAKGWRRLSAA